MPDCTQIHEYRNAAVFYFKEKKTDYKHGTAHKVYENKLQQDFYAPEINQKWCTDFTYLFLTNGSKRYNCTIIDLHDRSVIAIGSLVADNYITKGRSMLILFVNLRKIMVLINLEQ